MYYPCGALRSDMHSLLKIVIFGTILLIMHPARANTMSPSDLYREQQSEENKRKEKQAKLDSYCKKHINSNQDSVPVYKNRSWFTMLVITGKSGKKYVADFNNNTEKCAQTAILGQITKKSSKPCRTFNKTYQVGGTFQNNDFYLNPEVVKEQWIQEDDGMTLSRYTTTEVGKCPDHILKTHSGFISKSTGTKTERETFKRF